MLVFVVTKKVREVLAMRFGAELRWRMDMARGLKPDSQQQASGTTKVVP